MDNLRVVAVVYCIEQLQHYMGGIALGELPFGLGLPELTELAAFEVLHDHQKLLLFRDWEIVIEFHDALVSELTQGLDFFGDHVRHLSVGREVKDFYSNFILYYLIIG